MHGFNLSKYIVTFGDTNGDGQIDVSDASNILAHYSYSATGGKCFLKDFLNNN